MRWDATPASAPVLRRQRDLPLPRPRLRGAAVRPRRGARRRVAADRRPPRSSSPLWRRPWRVWRDLPRDGRILLLQWGAVLALMNCCFYIAIDRLPLGTVAAIEFLPVVLLAALGARIAPQRARAGAGGRRRLPAHRRPPRGRGGRARVRVRQRRAVRALHRARAQDRAPPGDHRHRRARAGDADRRRRGHADRRLGRRARRSPTRSRILAGLGVGVSSSVIPYVADQLAMRELPRATYALMVACSPPPRRSSASSCWPRSRARASSPASRS